MPVESARCVAGSQLAVALNSSLTDVEELFRVDQHMTQIGPEARVVVIQLGFGGRLVQECQGPGSFVIRWQAENASSYSRSRRATLLSPEVSRQIRAPHSRVCSTTIGDSAVPRPEPGRWRHCDAPSWHGRLADRTQRKRIGKFPTDRQIQAATTGSIDWPAGGFTTSVLKRIQGNRHTGPYMRSSSRPDSAIRLSRMISPSRRRGIRGQRVES